MQEDKSEQAINISNLLCKGGNQIESFCYQKYCTQQAILCINKQCKCYQQHQTCLLFLNAKKFLTNISNKKKPVDQSILKQAQLLDQLYQKVIDKISQHRQFFQLQVSNNGLNQREKSFLQSIQTNKLQKINGKFLNSINENQFVNIQKNFEKDLKRLWPKKRAQLFQQFRNLNKFFQQKWELTKFAPSKIHSDIIQDPTLIYSFLGDQVQFLKRIYSSQNKEIAFKDAVRDKKYIIVLVETMFNKVFGGYNPKGWTDQIKRRRERSRSPAVKSRWRATDRPLIQSSQSQISSDEDNFRLRRQQRIKINQDSQQQSFLFSISNKQKYSAIHKSNFTLTFQNLPFFGFQNTSNYGRGQSMHDFKIKLVDQYSQKYAVTVNFPVNYNNGKYVAGFEAVKQLSGGYDHKSIPLKCWEAFEVVWIDSYKNNSQ